MSETSSTSKTLKSSLSGRGHSISQSLRCDTHFRSRDGDPVAPAYHPKYRSFENGAAISAPQRRSKFATRSLDTDDLRTIATRVYPDKNFSVSFEGRSSNLQFWGDTLSPESLDTARIRRLSEYPSRNAGDKPHRYQLVIPPFGDRTEIPRPTTTQKNKHLIGPRGCESSQVIRNNGVCPNSPADLNINDVITFKDDRGFVKAVVKYIGHIAGVSAPCVGVELRSARGSGQCHDGIHQGQRYFQCAPRRGAFIQFNQVKVVYPSECD